CGPATAADFAAWAGVTLREARGLWARLEGELATIDVQGSEARLLLADVDRLSRARMERPHVRLLPYFDSYLLGHADRGHLVPDAHRRQVSRAQGWIAPVVLVDGRVLGVWKHARKSSRLAVEVTPLGRLTRRVVAGIQAEADELRRFLGAEDLQVTIGETGRT
ncbi:MAG TPA: crosslink repair DNA glycosylase YcaQ family protein, partial [Gaiella sp.]|nr:crosslink repair DNA glycosylase YcaQ family protein [Gaiella sp.]